MKNKNKTLKRLTATFLTATSVFNFTVPGKAGVVYFQPDKSIRYGEENDKIISAEALEEIRGKIKKELNTIKLGNEYHSKLSDYDTDNFTTVFKRPGMSNRGPEKDKWLDKEFVFECKNKKIYIIYSLLGFFSQCTKKEFENDKNYYKYYNNNNKKNYNNEKYFNPFDPEHKDSIFLVIAPDVAWKEMEQVYEQDDVKNKFIRFGRIIDNDKTIPWRRPVGIKDDNGNIQRKTITGDSITKGEIKIKVQEITANVTKREIRFIDPIQPILVYGGEILAACLISIPVIGPIIEQHIKNIKTKVNIKKTNTNTNINTHTNK